MASWKCLFCGFVTLVFSALLTHYNTNRHDTACTTTTIGSIPCGIGYCTKSFDKGNSFAKHVRTSHRIHLHCSPACDQHGIHAGSPGSTAVNNMDTGSKGLSEQSSEDFTDNMNEEKNNTTTDGEQINDSEVEMDELPDDLAKRYFLKIREENSLTTACTKKIMKTTAQLINTVVSNMKKKLVQTLGESNVPIADLPTFEDSFADTEEFLQNMISQSILGDTYEIGGEHVGMQKIILGTRKLLRKRNGKKRLVDAEDAFYYIPLLETLKAQLQSPILLDFILAGPVVSKDRNSLKDFCDGTFMKNHPLFGFDKKAIKIILYYDDVNVCNPLSNKMHKISAFYFQLANLPMKYRSKLKSINLLSLCTSTNIKRYGIDRVFEPLVEELKKLGDDAGYPFSIYQGTVKLRGGLLAVVADTPASQDSGGFKSGVGGAFRKCRHCMATYDSIQEYFTEDNFTLRCSTDHENWLKKMENAPSIFLETFYSKKSGITRRSKLLDAPDFDVCQQLPQDLMHVFLEGVLGYEIKYMLRYYIQQQNKFSLGELNSRIQNFLLGYSHKKNKPAPIFERDLERESSSNLGQSASEMWLLSRILPFILHEYLDTSSEYWTCYTTLLEIVAICFSQTITYTEIIYLKQLIRDHLSLFKRLYQAPIIPKQHYMVHIPSLTLMFGPLIRSWAMRFESKHTYFKTLAKNTKNFKNLPYSLASRFLAKDYAENIQLDKDVPMSSLFKDSIELGKAKQIMDKNDKRCALSTIKRFYDIDPPVTEKVYLCDSVSVQNKSYVTGENNLVIWNKTADGLPEFGCIKKIWFCKNHGIFLVLEIRDTVSFSDTFQAFQVNKCNAAQGYQVTMPADLISFDVVHTYTVNGKSYIPLRETIFG